MKLKEFLCNENLNKVYKDTNNHSWVLLLDFKSLTLQNVDTGKISESSNIIDYYDLYTILRMDFTQVETNTHSENNEVTLKNLEDRIKESLLNLNTDTLLDVIDNLCDYTESARPYNYRKNNKEFLLQKLGPNYLIHVQEWINNGSYSLTADSNNEYAKYGTYGSIQSFSKQQVMDSIRKDIDSLFDDILDYYIKIGLPDTIISLIGDYKNNIKSVVNSLKDKNLDITKNPHLANEAKYICDRFKW